MKKLLYILVLATLPVMIQAAATDTLSIPWQCGFEQSEPWASEWVLNPGTPTATDQWMVGSAVHSEGQQSLYVSTDGTNASFGTHPDIVMAYRIIQFPERPTKEYDVSFEWRSVGESGTLYVYLNYASVLLTGPNSLLQYATSKLNSKNMIPKSVLNNANFVYSGSMKHTQTMQNMASWQSVSIDAGEGTNYSIRLTRKNSKKPVALVFVWVNNNTSQEEIAAGACIDNIQITSATYPKPTNLKVERHCEDSSLLVTWNGGLDAYSVEYRRTTASSWRRFTLSEVGYTHQYHFKGLKDGTYDVRVRGWKKNSMTGEVDTTGYVSVNSYLLYCPDNQCINYADLENPNCVCTYGEYKSSQIDPLQYVGVIDHGWDQITTFHAVCTQPNVYDIRTKNGLKTIPDGSLASVRLGTWLCPSSNSFQLDDTTQVKIGGYAITYDMQVDTTTQGILLLNYAMVMESAHNDDTRAYFKLEVLDENDNLLDATCGTKEFYCPYDSIEAFENGWKCYHHEDFSAIRNKDLGLNSSDIYWKDWTRMGLNLLEAGAKHGDHLKVRITARGCTAGGHYCYGYFTLGCASATIETDQCGDNPVATADAPDGFTYVWFAEKNRELYESGTYVDDFGNKVIVSREQDLLVQKGDTNIYVCRMIDQVEPSCWFELKTKLSPRNPYAMYNYAHVPSQCHNYVQFKDSSRVIDYGPDGSIKVSAEACEYSQWTIRSLVTGEQISSSSSDVLFDAKLGGDTLQVIQTAYMADAKCENTHTTTVIVPDITTPDSLAQVTICDNQFMPFTIDGVSQRLTEPGEYSNNMLNRFGCDSIIHLSLKVNPTSKFNLIDTIHDGQVPYIIEGLYNGAQVSYKRGEAGEFATTNHYTLKLSNSCGCDSTINLTLTVVPRLQKMISTIPDYLCADAGVFELPYTLYAGDYDSLTVEFDSVARLHGFRDTVIVHDPYQKPVGHPFAQTLSFQYPDTMLPGTYKVLVSTYQHPVCNTNSTDTLWLNIRYNSRIIEQKWNDVLALTNDKYNGGYEFTDYQWYENGQMIAGATMSYLYVPQGLNFNSEYTVVLTRKDGVVQAVCPFFPEDRSGLQISQYPTLIHANEMIALRGVAPAQVYFFTPAGQLYKKEYVAAEQTLFAAPDMEGYYICQINTADGESVRFKMLVVQ